MLSKGQPFIVCTIKGIKGICVRTCSNSISLFSFFCFVCSPSICKSISCVSVREEPNNEKSSMCRLCYKMTTFVLLLLYNERRSRYTRGELTILISPLHSRTRYVIKAARRNGVKCYTKYWSSHHRSTFFPTLKTKGILFEIPWYATWTTCIPVCWFSEILRVLFSFLPM